MEGFKERLLKEKEELDEKREKLSKFLQSDKIFDIDDRSRNLLSRQFKVMTLYSKILKERIEILGIDK